MYYYLKEEQIEAFYQAICDHDTIIIHRHERPDPDALGSQNGLQALIEAAFPEKKILLAGTDMKSLAWLGKMDKVHQEVYKDALVIVCDTANRERIDGKYFGHGAYLIKIDHHLLVDSYGDPEIACPQAGSTSEILTLMSQYLGDRLPMTKAAAYLLYAGILGDTGRFLFATSPATFQAAAFLAEFDLPLREISDHFQVMSLEEVRFQGYAYQQVQVDQASGVAYLDINQETIKEYGISEDQTHSVVNLPSQIQGIYAWVSFIEQEGDNPKWRVRLRSKGPAINTIAEHFQGGGHAMASGAKLNQASEKAQVLEELKTAVASYLEDQAKL